MTVKPKDMGLSLILPVWNEEHCVGATLREAHAVLRAQARPFEILAVDDGSNDRTHELLRGLARELAALRVLRLNPHSGQSAAMWAGLRHSRGAILVFMDADGQNDPADIPKLIAGLESHDVCCGYRADRQDSLSKRLGSRLANFVRNRVLGERIRDTGCSLKAFKRHVLADLPVWDGMHRFLPALAAMKGAAIAEVPVNHRPRPAGKSKYTNRGRLLHTLADLRGVRWMKSRYRRFEVEVCE